MEARSVTIRKVLRPSQEEAVLRWQKALLGGFIFQHEQRTGKTLPALKCVVLSGAVQVLIICLKKGVSVWQKEINESLPPDWSVEQEIHHFQYLQNKKQFNQLKRWMKKRPTFMIVDEAHHIKRRGSIWSRRCRALARYSDWRLALTGTLIAQGIQDAWAVFDYIDPGVFGPWAVTRRVINPETRRPIIEVIGGFQHSYLLMHPKWHSKVIGYQNEEEFKRIYHQHVYRITLREAQKQAGQKPTIVRRQVLEGHLDPRARGYYTELEEQLRTVVNRKRIETPLVITLSMKLQQICGGWIIDEDGEPQRLGRKPKMQLLSKALALIEGRKVVVVCRFIHEIEPIVATLQAWKYTVDVIRGGTEFDASKPITVDAIVLQIQAGVSVDLAFADTMIYYSWDHSHINSEQSRFRILHFKATRVNYYYLVMKNTVDQLMLEAIVRKKNFAELISDHYRRQK